MSIKNKRPKLTISITSKNKQDLNIWVKTFSGNIYIDKSYTKKTYKWSIQSKKNILSLLEYLKNFPLHTLKQNRVLMISQYYRYYEKHAFKEENTILNKKWEEWRLKWRSWGLERDENL